MRPILNPAVLAVVLCAVAGCGGPAPSASPGGPGGIVAALVRQGFTIEAAVSGRSACADPSLQGNALAMRLRALALGEAGDVYLYVFRPREYERGAAAVTACADAFARSSGRVVQRLDVAPYRAMGVGWSRRFREAVEAALREAARGS